MTADSTAGEPRPHAKGEQQLTADLITAVTGAQQPLSQEQIDEILGLHDRDR